MNMVHGAFMSSVQREFLKKRKALAKYIRRDTVPDKDGH